MSRFTIRRMPLDTTSRSPWLLRDRERPYYIGASPTFERAVAKVDRILRAEAGLPPRLDITTAEIMAEMEKRPYRETLSDFADAFESVHGDLRGESRS